MMLPSLLLLLGAVVQAPADSVPPVKTAVAVSRTRA